MKKGFLAQKVYICIRNMKNMKKIAILALAALICAGVSAQNIRTNYRSGGITHISTDYESLRLGDTPALIRVEQAQFSDGSLVYLLYINLLQESSVVAPKGVKMSATLVSGKLLRLEQIGQDSATKRRLEDGNFLNRLKYAVEPADMGKLTSGIQAVDIVTGWNPDDFLQANFKADELGSLLKRHCQAIKLASESTVELTATLSGYTENTNSILSAANPVVGRGAGLDYNILLSHLFYKNTAQEDIDLAFVLGTEEKYHIPFDSPVRFTLRDGSEITLLQARDDVNFVYLYPSMEDLYKMVAVGIAAISIGHENGTLEDTFPKADEDFTAALNQELQLLLSLSPR